MSGRKAILAGTQRFSKKNTFLGLGFALVLPICCVMASAQTGVPVERGRLAGETTAEAPSPSTSAASEQEATDQATQAAKPGSVIGTVLDQSGAVSVGTVIRLTPEDKFAYREVITGDNGQFSLHEHPSGPLPTFRKFDGVRKRSVLGGSRAGADLFLAPPIVLSVATVVTQVKVTVDPVEVATEQIKEEGYGD